MDMQYVKSEITRVVVMPMTISDIVGWLLNQPNEFFTYSIADAIRQLVIEGILVTVDYQLPYEGAKVVTLYFPKDTIIFMPSNWTPNLQKEPEK